jgi:PhnB protein
MTIRLNPYLSFRDEARQAMEHYREVFGGELTLSTFGDFGASDDPAERDKIMHGQLETPHGLVLMGADTPASMPREAGTNDFSVSLSGGTDDLETLRGWYDRLVDGGRVLEPLATAPWGDTFGMCVDRFGTSWQVNVAAQST